MRPEAIAPDRTRGVGIVGRLAGSLLLTACAACSMTVTVTPLTNNKYPPTDPENLKLYNRRPPGEWEEIVRIEIEGTDSDGFDDTRKRARQEAAQLGAEAIVIHGERTESKSSYVPPTEFRWTEYKSNYKIEHTRKTEGGRVHYSVPVCEYVGVRRGKPSSSDASTVPKFSCPKCATQWQSPPEDDVYECTCGQYMYVLSCVHCRKRFVWSRPGDDTCPSCRRSTAVILCPHCNHAESAQRYSGKHGCKFCRKDYWGMICPGCGKTLVSDTYFSPAECPECHKQFEVSKDLDSPKPRVEDGAGKGYLGLALEDLPPEDCNRLMLPVGEAVVVLEILEGSPAEKCGLRVGDVIVRIEDATGDRWGGKRDGYLAWVRSKSPGTTITVTVLRDEKTLRIQAVLTAREK